MRLPKSPQMHDDLVSDLGLREVDRGLRDHLAIAEAVHRRGGDAHWLAILRDQIRMPARGLLRCDGKLDELVRFSLFELRREHVDQIFRVPAKDHSLPFRVRRFRLHGTAAHEVMIELAHPCPFDFLRSTHAGSDVGGVDASRHGGLEERTQRAVLHRRVEDHRRQPRHTQLGESTLGVVHGICTPPESLDAQRLADLVDRVIDGRPSL